MREKTLDLLEDNLSAIQNQHLAQDGESRLRHYTEGFLLDRTYWDQYFPLINRHRFNWNEFKYSAVSPDTIDNLIQTDETGVYIFVVKSENLFLDMPKYVFYVGIAGEGDSARPLRTRLKDYFRLGGILKRKKVHRMLSWYYSNVYVNYSTLNIPYADLEELEVNLHGFFHPICNERDFPIEIKQFRQAF